MRELIPQEVIENRIFLIRGQKVMIDKYLATLYGVSTKRLNEQVKRNRERFPNDFMFKLSKIETELILGLNDSSRSQIGFGLINSVDNVCRCMSVYATI